METTLHNHNIIVIVMLASCQMHSTHLIVLLTFTKRNMRPMTDEQCGQGHNTRDEQSWIYIQERLGPKLVLFLPNYSVIPNSTECF